MSSDNRSDNRLKEIIQRITGPVPGLWIPERLHRKVQRPVRLGTRWIVAASRGYATGTNATPTELLQRLRALPFPDLLYVLASIGLIATREPLGAQVYRKLASIFLSKDELRSLVAAVEREEDPKPDAIQVFTRGGILLATKLALALGDNSAESSNDLTRLGSYLLDVNDFVAGARYRSGQGNGADISLAPAASVGPARLPNGKDVPNRNFDAKDDPIVLLFEVREVVDVLRYVEQVDQRERRIQFRPDVGPVGVVLNELTEPFDFRGTRRPAVAVKFLVVVLRPWQDQFVGCCGVKHALEQLAHRRSALSPPIRTALG